MRRLGKFLRRLGSSTGGVAIIEFGLTFPVLLFAALTCFELANMALQRMKVTRTATTMADLVAQSVAGIDEAQVADLFASSELIFGSPDIRQIGRLYISAVRGGGEDIGNTILWMRCDGNASTLSSTIGSDDNTEVILPNGIEVSEGEHVVVAQVSVRYQPLMLPKSFNNFTLTHTATFKPRSLSFGPITAASRTASSNCGVDVTQHSSDD